MAVVVYVDSFLLQNLRCVADDVGCFNYVFKLNVEGHDTSASGGSGVWFRVGSEGIVTALFDFINAYKMLQMLSPIPEGAKFRAQYWGGVVLLYYMPCYR